MVTYTGRTRNQVSNTRFNLVNKCIWFNPDRYDYGDYCTDVTKFPRPRFASEFGFQSYSSFHAMSQVSGPAVSD